jgi:RNA polymerase sigma-70 factor (ECF subfamily)
MALGPRAQNVTGDAASPRPASAAPASEDDADAALVRRCQRGDVDAFGTLVTRHEARVAALVARVLGPTATPDDVSDTAQDVFIQAWRALPRFRGDARFSTWLYRIATNMAIKEWHRNKRKRQVVDDEPLPEGARTEAVTPAQEAERRARDRALQAAVDALPEKQRTVVLLHYFEDYTCEEVAQMVGCSVGTVWSRLHYACRKLRGTLDWLEQS